MTPLTLYQNMSLADMMIYGLILLVIQVPIIIMNIIINSIIIKNAVRKAILEADYEMKLFEEERQRMIREDMIK